MNVATAHHAESVNGGGERVAWELARTFDAPLFVASRNEDIEPDDVDVRDLHDSGLGRRLVDHGDPLRILGHQAGWSTAHDLRDYDAVVTSGNPCLSYVPADQQPWVHYAHHTTRDATDDLPAVAEKHTGRLGGVIKRVEYAQRWFQRQVSSRAAHKPTLMVANSEPVAERIRTYWGVPEEDIRTVYPPVATESFGSNLKPTKDYYVTVSRLDGHKEIGEIVKAFNRTNKRLLVAGDGPERHRLEKMAANNVAILGYVSELRKRELLSGAKGFVFNARSEDFGIAPVEALASGTPVISVAEGFPEHLVRDGINGCQFERGVGNLLAAVDRMEEHGISWTDEDLEQFAAQFSVDRFRQEMRDVVEEAQERKHVTADLSFETQRSADRLRTDGGDHEPS